MIQLHVMIGIPASGKSTIAEKLREVGAQSDNVPVVVSSDALRMVLTGDPAAPLDRDAEMWPLFHASIESALNAGYDVVADATNLTESSRAPYLKQNPKVVEVIAHVMAVPFSAALLRNSLRDRFVPEDVMIDMQTRFDAFSTRDLYDEGFDKVILHDMSGVPIEV